MPLMLLRKTVLMAAGVAGIMALVGAAVLTQRTAAKTGSNEAVYTPKKKGTLTFNKDIAPIVLSNCASCHREGEIGPFRLETYEDVKKRAGQIADITTRHLMPPWHADSHGEFFNERKLTAEQIGI